MVSVQDATLASIEAATHLTPMDAGAIAAVLALAVKIDMADDYFDALADAASERNLRPPAVDNVSIPTYLKYCESLGLTPAGRLKIEPAKSGGDSGGSKLGKLRSVHTSSA